jgi:tetratricopeptide (TPR) repeat protein
MGYLQRVLSLVCLGLIPPFGPLDARTATHAAQLAALVAVAVLAWSVARTRSRTAMAATAVSLAAAFAGAAIFVGERGPLARGVFVMAPAIWAALVASTSAAAGARAPAFLRDPRRALGVGALVGVLLTTVGIARFSSRVEMWRRIAQRDPASEQAALALAHTRGTDTRAVLLRCVEAASANCACARELANLPSEPAHDAWVLSVSPACRADASIAAKVLRSLLLRGDNDGVLGATDAILARTPNDANALIARATAQWRTNDPNTALMTARRALGGPRNLDAHMLVGNLLLARKDLDGAAAEFAAALAADPNHAPAHYNRALIADMRNRYDEAREGYLAALRIEPGLSDARYNLVLLTRRFGVAAEAQHHLELLAKIAPNDPRLPRLRALLQSP